MGDEEFGAPEEESSGGGGNLKMIIIIAVIAIVMGAAGFFAGKILTGGDSDQPAQAGDTQAGAQGQTGDQQGTQGNTSGNQSSTVQPGSGGDQPTDTPVPKSNKGILVLDSFTVNLNDPFGRRYIEVVLNMMVEPKSMVPKIKENELLMPQIRHEIFMTISSKSYGELKSTSGKHTLFEEIQMRVNEIIKQELGVEPVVRVLQTKFLIQ